MSEQLRNYQDAVTEERDGAAKYRRWAAETDDPEDKAILLKMADQEEGHEQHLQYMLHKKPMKTVVNHLARLIDEITYDINVHHLSNEAMEKINEVIDYALDVSIEQDGRDPEKYEFSGELIISGEFISVKMKLIGTYLTFNFDVNMKNINIDDVEKIRDIIKNDNMCPAPKPRKR